MKAKLTTTHFIRRSGMKGMKSNNTWTEHVLEWNGNKKRFTTRYSQTMRDVKKFCRDMGIEIAEVVKLRDYHNSNPSWS